MNEPDETGQAQAARQASTARAETSLDADDAGGFADALSCLELLERLWPSEGEASEGEAIADHSASAPLELPCRVGRFEVRKLLGQGGFGLVFLAFDPAIDREVALKLPRPEVLPSRSAHARFLREARAAGVLDHPHIVPTFECGSIGPIPYIVQGLCRGPSLARWLAEQAGGASPEIAAAIALQLGQAVSHAHARGVLHRDLKPSNVLLEPTGATSDFPYVVRLSDFGLARFIDGDRRETRTGTRLGTIQYMAPEQLRGDTDQIDERTDIYALGVLLHEMLSGRPPFDSKVEIDTARRIAEEPPPALSPRGRLARDLAIISRKCLEKRREDRYATAAELVDDLQRAIEGRPLKAKPLPASKALARWCRRRPVVAALLFVSCASLVLGLAATTWMYQRERAQSAIASRQRELARGAVHDMYTEVAEKWMSETPHMERKRLEFLRKALAYYEEAHRLAPADASALHDLSVALHRTANVELRLGLTRDAVKSRCRCLEILDQLLALAPRDPQYRFDRFYNLMMLASDEQSFVEPRRTLATSVEAHRLIEELHRESPGNAAYADALAAMSVSLAKQHRGAKQFDPARTLLHRALELSAELGRRHPDQPLYQKSAGEAHGELAALAEDEGDQALALEHRQQCLDVFKSLAAHFPSDPTLQFVAARGGLRLTEGLFATGQFDRGAATLDDALAAAHRLTRDYPRDTNFTKLHIDLLECRARRFSRDNQPEAACRDYSAAIDLLTRSVSAAPGDDELRRRLQDIERRVGLEVLSNAQSQAAR